MLAGFRQYGNFPLPARADMNDVLAALAREAGWTVEADGTTYRSAIAGPVPSSAPFPTRSIGSPASAGSLKNSSVKSSLDCQAPVLMIDECLSPTSLDSVVVAERDPKSDRYRNPGAVNSLDCVEADQVGAHPCTRYSDAGRSSGGNDDDFSGTPYIPVYSTLPTGVVNSYCQLVDPEAVRQQLRHLKSLNVDGVVVDCWWGLSKAGVVLAFHECGASGSGDVPISLPKWVLEVGKDNQDIFFTDRGGRRNTECISWGVDRERVLCGRTGIEVYFDFMRSFRTEFDDLFAEGLISGIEVGLGASGELKFPSFSERMGWRYPGIGEFQCYDRYLQQSLRRAAKGRGHAFWARGPDNAGHYNSQPHETGFFCERGDYDSYYGRFFLHWYAQTLVAHADAIPAVFWWYRTASHAAELTAGFHNPTNQDGYSPLFDALKKHSAVVKFVCPGRSERRLGPGLTVAGQNSARGHDLESLRRMLETAKPRSDPDRRHFGFFVYQQPSTFAQRELSLSELLHFVKNMHGELAPSLTLASTIACPTSCAKPEIFFIIIIIIIVILLPLHC
ncbi:unnamed protein product [Spirodela intermedia]|uniref:Beta-amylase n=1 Tax=Spirodela intermedia TaxID=51605 RepID=A0A7I8JPH3_SPIIN|nr:unnamed protein product [Spirodela intermedia]CAA6672079.1 unnamed protein product [Spirodela intermedia]